MQERERGGNIKIPEYFVGSVQGIGQIEEDHENSGRKDDKREEGFCS